MRKHYLYIFILLFFSCQESLQFPCNTRDQNADCYIAPPSLDQIISYDVDILHISLEKNNDADDIFLTRHNLNEKGETIFNHTDTIPAFIEGNYITFSDSRTVESNTNYIYDIIYLNTDGDSDPYSLGPYSHNFLAPDSISITPENSVSMLIKWRAPDQFHIPRDVINFEIEEIVVKNDTNSTTNLIFHSPDIDTVDTDGDGVGWYEISRDIESIDADESIEYKYIIIENRNGQFSYPDSSDSYKVDNPSIDTTYWVPLSSKSIFLKWNFDPTTMILNADYRLEIESEYTGLSLKTDILDGNGQISSENHEGFFVDNIPDYYSGIPNGGVLTYTLRWYNSDEEQCGTHQIQAATFPIHNMVYIPSFRSLPGSEFESDLSSSHFYIDVYEVSEYLYNNPEFSGDLDLVDYDVNEKKPFIVDAASADNFCNNYRDPEGTPFPIDFKLPSDTQWMIAAGVGYDESQIDFSDEHGGGLSVDGNLYFDYTSVQSGGMLDCSYANILGCNLETIDVGSYNGDNSNLSTSPNGLYDCSGNVMEWVDAESGKAMGGYYHSSSSQATSSSYIMLDCTNCIGTGFRTIIEANTFLPDFREAVEP